MTCSVIIIEIKTIYMTHPYASDVMNCYVIIVENKTIYMTHPHMYVETSNIFLGSLIQSQYQLDTSEQ